VSLQPERAEGVMAFMPFYFERYCWTTRGWPTEARWAYLILLCEQYTTGHLPADPKVLDRLSPGTLEHWDLIEPKIPLDRDGLRRNDRCSQHREKSLGIAHRRREAARIAALAKHGHMPHARETDASRMPDGCETDASRRVSGSGSGSGSEIGSDSNSETHTLNGVAVEPVSVQTETVHIRTKRMPMPDGALERLWHLFPRKVGKKRAFLLLERAIRDYATEWDLDALDDAVEVMRERIVAMAQQYRKTEQAYIPHPATWLQQGRYEDPIPEETRR
jgi:uncharacterized protein YdaU (DUF1376 family)